MLERGGDLRPICPVREPLGYLKLEKSDRNCTSRHQQVLKRWTPFEPAEHVYVGAMACVAVLGAALEDHVGV